MKLAVFGATGQTGIQFLKQALCDLECHLKAMVRNPEKLNNQLKEIKDPSGKEMLDRERLTIVQVNEDLNSDEFVDHLKDVDVVVSMLGFPIQRPSTYV